jgi:hypothetical protein
MTVVDAHQHRLGQGVDGSWRYVSCKRFRSSLCQIEGSIEEDLYRGLPSYFIAIFTIRILGAVEGVIIITNCVFVLLSRIIKLNVCQ